MILREQVREQESQSKGVEPLKLKFKSFQPEIDSSTETGLEESELELLKSYSDFKSFYFRIKHTAQSLPQVSPHQHSRVSSGLSLDTFPA